MATDNFGNIFVDDSMLRRVQKFSLTLASPQIVTTSNQATVTWTEVEGATDLELEWSIDGKSWSKKPLTANETHTTIYPLIESTTYQFRLSGNFGPGQRMASDLVEAKTANIPLPSYYPDTVASSEPLKSTNGLITLPAGKTGEVSLEDKIGISIPAHASDKELKLTIEKVLNPQKFVNNHEVLSSSIFEIVKSFPENLSKPVKITLLFDSTILKNDQSVGVFYYDDEKKEWIGVSEGKINGNHISVEVNHFGKFSVFVVDQATGKPITNNVTETISSDTAGHWAEASIKQAISSGIVKGYPDGTFKPNHTVTRAEFAEMLMNTLKPQGEGVTPTFTDTAEIGAWANKAIAQAVQAGIIKGNPNGAFRPNVEITRAEMAEMIARAMSLSIDANAITDFADDKDIPTWAKASVAKVKSAGILQGRGSNKFAAQDHATRAEAITVLLKILVQESK
ncbi:S-layer homology domain-containing protein [Cohnella abietis]|uniref:S-layer homology domain-containing protein n=1 Tax=Cohnella abietis TaxID=2507935 RepID=UPI00138FDD94|nr:S-layer homology domain-containing protein [Cohnella abietis]